MKIHLCSEVVRDLDFASQCRFARETGYDGLEIAPFTLSPEPQLLPPGEIASLRSIADSEGVAIAGLHWLMGAPDGLSITSTEDSVASFTRDTGLRLVELCAGFGGAYLVHGSPLQRPLDPGREDENRERAVAYFAAMGSAADAAGVTYIVEPLSREDTPFINTVDEALAIIEDAGGRGLATMVDCFAAASNGEAVPDLLRHWIAESVVRHVHFNDVTRRGPGEGPTDFAAILKALADAGYEGTTAVEPFIYTPDGPSCAARAIGYLRGLIDGATRDRLISGPSGRI
jgi:sugar phosphate isomerase/epimerase